MPAGPRRRVMTMLATAAAISVAARLAPTDEIEPAMCRRFGTVATTSGSALMPVLGAAMRRFSITNQAVEKGTGGRRMDSVRDADVRTVRIVVATLVGLAILVFLGTKLFGGDDDESSPERAPAIGLTEAQLRARGATLAPPAYWVGPQPDTSEYEFSTTADGRNYIRYLTGGAEPGNSDPDYLTVGTYVVPDAAEALQRSAEGGTGTVSHEQGYDLLPGQGSNVYVVLKSQP